MQQISRVILEFTSFGQPIIFAQPMSDQSKAPGGPKAWTIFKPNLREIIGEAYKIVLGAILTGLGLLLGRLIPMTGNFLDHDYLMPLYQIGLFVLGGLLAGCGITLIVQGDLIRRLQDLTRRDELTKLMNLRAFNELSEQTLQYARSHKEPISILFIDIDGFKKLNIDYGFETCSYILQQLAQVLTLNPRVRDQFFRYGGDEFLVLVPNTPATGGLMYAQNIRRGIKSTPFKVLDGKSELNITISIGVAELDVPGGQTRSAFVRCAELALNRAKMKKDDVCVYDPTLDKS